MGEILEFLETAGELDDEAQELWWDMVLRSF